MNTGQRLVELSGLPSGSALAHFAAITQTGGTGPGETRLVNLAAVCSSERRLELKSSPEERTVLVVGHAQAVFDEFVMADAQTLTVRTKQATATVRETTLSHHIPVATTNVFLTL